MPNDPIPSSPATAWPEPDAGIAIETGLFGRLVVPADPARADELRELAAQAAAWATRARRGHAARLPLHLETVHRLVRPPRLRHADWRG